MNDTSGSQEGQIWLHRLVRIMKKEGSSNDGVKRFAHWQLIYLAHFGLKGVMSSSESLKSCFASLLWKYNMEYVSVLQIGRNWSTLFPTFPWRVFLLDERRHQGLATLAGEVEESHKEDKNEAPVGPVVNGTEEPNKIRGRPALTNARQARPYSKEEKRIVIPLLVLPNPPYQML